MTLLFRERGAAPATEQESWGLSGTGPTTIPL
jgi:hypothetical protein